MHLAETGLCEHGEQESLIQSGATTLGGRLPVNTDGGCLANGEPIGASGLRQVHEVVLQLRGEAGERQIAGPARVRVHAGLRRARASARAPCSPLSAAREVQPVAYPDGELRASDFRDRRGAGARAPARARCWSATRGRRSIPGLRLRLARERARRATSRRSASAGDGRDHDRGRGRRVARGRVPPGRHGLARGRLARLRRRARRARRRSAGSARSPGWTSTLAPPQRYLGPLGGMGLTAYAGLFDVGRAARRRRRLGLGRGRRGRQPRRAVRQAARAPRHRERRVRREGRVTCSTSSGSTRRSTTAPGPSAALLRAAAPDGIDVYFDCVGGDHLEAALGVAAPAAGGSRCAAPSRSTSAVRRPGRATCSRRRPTT